MSLSPPSPPAWLALLNPERADLYNHLRHPRSTKRLASHKRLALDRRQDVAETRDRQEDAGDNEGRGAADAGQEDDDSHDAVGGGAHVVGRDLADGVVEGRRGRADAEKERHFDEEDHEGEAPRRRLVLGFGIGTRGSDREASSGMRPREGAAVVGCDR